MFNMFSSRESVNINYNQSSCNYSINIPSNCGFYKNDITNACRVEPFDPFPALLCSPKRNVEVINSSNTCKYSNNVLNNAVIYSNRDKYKHYYSPVEFYSYRPENQKKNSGTYHRHSHSSYKIKPPRDILKTTLKKKRKRTTFTTEQIVALEEVFNSKPYITREERIMMTKKLQVNEKSIKVWFQNRRRLTDKRCKDYRSDSPSSEDMSDSFSDRLTIIESNIYKSTDVNGYVTLDNNTMAELVNVINEYLSQDTNSYVKETIQPVVSEKVKVIYEPISPASSIGNPEEIELGRDSD